jgi:hypothetical protein
MLKDKLLLLSINPANGYMRAQGTMSYMVLCAALFDLVLLGKLSVISGKISVLPGPVNDPVLNELLQKLGSMQDKKLATVLYKLSFTAGKFYKSQVSYLEHAHMISVKPLIWLGITWGKIYRVNRAEKLKTTQSIFERVLIYGRKTTTENRLLMELLGYVNILYSYFDPPEYKQIARQRLRALCHPRYENHHESLSAIGKQLTNHLKASKAMKG